MAGQTLPVLGFDTETTGTSVARDRIVTAALVRRDASGELWERTWLIAPDIDIPPQASAVHGITTEHARANGLPAAQALDEIAGVIAQHSHYPIVVFNAGFDLPILDSELARHSLPTLPDRLGRPVRPVLDPLVLDRATDRWRKGKRTLEAMVDHYGVAVGGSLHDALEDVRSTIGVLDAILARNPRLAAGELDQLHDWQAAKHREWAKDFNRWLESKGRTPDVRPDWP
ncbi:MAG: DNA polymerase III subunit epsilon [Bifidobacteriaceae bacterium]|jgi:DNA polymerase-3 subunit epsilon|nr:DNA polymerase III subunit epsilon [Bifidobacteriaceae bacterium]